MDIYGRSWTHADNHYGGQGGIRTPGTVTRTPHFECCAFNHSATCPSRKIRYLRAPTYASSARFATGLPSELFSFVRCPLLSVALYPKPVRTPSRVRYR